MSSWDWKAEKPAGSGLQEARTTLETQERGTCNSIEVQLHVKIQRQLSMAHSCKTSILDAEAGGL